jgi:hypothetical protein
MDDDIKQSSSKHALAPTDPLQVEADSEDQNAKRIVCGAGEFFFGSFWCIHHNREQRRKRP